MERDFLHQSIFVVASILMALPNAVVAADETPADVIAVEVRKHGLPCKNPHDAQRDKSAADIGVWTIVCEGATYRVHMIPDMGSKVEKIDASTKSQ